MRIYKTCKHVNKYLQVTNIRMKEYTAGVVFLYTDMTICMFASFRVHSFVVNCIPVAALYCLYLLIETNSAVFRTIYLCNHVNCVRI